MQLEEFTIQQMTPDPDVRRLRPYLTEVFADEDTDDGMMPDNVDELAKSVVGRRIVSTTATTNGCMIALDDGTTVTLSDTHDCCAYTDLDGFLLHPESVNHVILGVGTTDGYETWHIYADFGDVLNLDVSWSCGNPFYYGYGFDIKVARIDDADADVGDADSTPTGIYFSAPYRPL